MDLFALLRPVLVSTCAACVLATPAPRANGEAPAALKREATAAMRKAAEYYRSKVASHGGYVYYYAADFSRRWGEGEADADQIWVQRPGTPAVGLAFLRAYSATKDRFYLDAATDAARALVQGQLVSGGWTNYIDFSGAGGKNAPRYRKLKGGGPRNHSSLDDGVTQHALRLLMRVDQALEFRDPEIHEAVEYALGGLLKAQFPSGGFPQGWTDAVPPHPFAKATYPDYDWRTENRIKNYWELPTLNDDLAVGLVECLEDAWIIYKEPRYRDAVAKLGDFLMLAQMPDPQPAWAQQYDHQMRPVWARKFEPPAIAGRESQGAMRALLNVHRITGNAKYLEPIPRAIAYLRSCILPDGQLPRYSELKTNRPLYMTKSYELAYDDKDTPTHYGWKTGAKLDSIQRDYEAQRSGKFRAREKLKVPSEETVRAIVNSLDSEGRWLSTYKGEGLVGQPKFQPGFTYLSSEVFSENLEALGAFVASIE